MGGPSQSVFEVGHALDKIEQRGAHRAVLEYPPRFHKRMELFRTELSRERLKLGIAVGRVDELEDGHLKESRKADETVERNAVAAVFVFLYLLETHFQKLSNLALALAGGAARGAEIMPQIAVERTFWQAFFVSSGHGQNLLFVA